MLHPVGSIEQPISYQPLDDIHIMNSQYRGKEVHYIDIEPYEDGQKVLQIRVLWDPLVNYRIYFTQHGNDVKFTGWSYGTTTHRVSETNADLHEWDVIKLIFEWLDLKVEKEKQVKEATQEFKRKELEALVSSIPSSEEHSKWSRIDVDKNTVYYYFSDTKNNHFRLVAEYERVSFPLSKTRAQESDNKIQWDLFARTRTQTDDTKTVIKLKNMIFQRWYERAWFRDTNGLQDDLKQRSHRDALFFITRELRKSESPSLH